MKIKIIYCDACYSRYIPNVATHTLKVKGALEIDDKDTFDLCDYHFREVKSIRPTAAVLDFIRNTL
jgi:hypothetical protein